MPPSQVIQMSHEDLFHPSPDTAKSQKESFLSSLPAHGVSPLWTQMSKMSPPAPSPKATPQVWKYDELRPYLLQSGRIVTAHEAERRVMIRRMVSQFQATYC